MAAPTLLDVATFCPYCPATLAPGSSADHQVREHPDKVRALSTRRARDGRRRRAAEAGRDWTRVR